ncbi:unnamed protein product [Gadus morhua 'NCC']
MTPSPGERLIKTYLFVSPCAPPSSTLTVHPLAHSSAPISLGSCFCFLDPPQPPPPAPHKSLSINGPQGRLPA